MFNRLQDLIDRIPSGLRRVIIAVVVLALLAVFFPLQQDVNRLNQTMPPLTPTPAPAENSAGGDAINTSTSGAETSSGTNEGSTNAGAGVSSSTSEADTEPTTGADSGTEGSTSNSTSSQSPTPALSETPPPSATSRASATPRLSATPRPSATPTATLVPCGPDEGWVIYTVRSGDTLNAIAQLSGATVQELVACNELANPDALRVNQQLFVPELPSQFVTATATPSITPTPSVTPTART